LHYVLLALLGLVVGTFGTLVGAGGGFILTPDRRSRSSSASRC
jgi:uncharacterized membrane protein YfcA